MNNPAHPEEQIHLQVLSGKLFQIRSLTWPDSAALTVKELWRAIRNPDEVLKDDRRSRVLKSHLLSAGTDLSGSQHPQSAGASLDSGAACVFKRVLYKDRRLLNRFLSFFQSAEACLAFDGSIQLLEAGFPVPRPRALLEHRHFGFLVEAWFVYDFVIGDPVEEKDWPEVVALLRKLHDLGFAHGDPHLANWLRSSGGVVAIDLIPRSLSRVPRQARSQKARDFLLIRNCRPEILPLLPGVGELPWRMEEKRYRHKLGLRALRKWLRSFF